MFRAGGWNGQGIMIFVELDIVIVFMGGNYDKKLRFTNFLKNIFYLLLNNILNTTMYMKNRRDSSKI